jgi:Zn-dependent protease
MEIYAIIIVIFSAVIHEVAHGFVAYKLGDPTAKLAGRLTLNPLKHLDPFGSILLPFLLSLMPGNIIFGWAKPVPYNPYNLKNPEKMTAYIAVAGPLSNIFLAILFAFFSRIISSSSFTFLFPYYLINNLNYLLSIIVMINITLAIFNLLPIPPLDGSKIARFLIPQKFHSLKRFFDEDNYYGWIILLIFIFFGYSLIFPVIHFIFKLLLGIS